MSTLTRIIFPNAQCSKCLHLEIDTSKTVSNISVLEGSDGLQVLSACSESCINEITSMSSLDVYLCCKCSTNTNVSILKHRFNGIDYYIYTCPNCTDANQKALDSLKSEIQCDGCDKMTTKRCVCLKVGYCSRECQIQKRPQHKTMCQQT